MSGTRWNVNQTERKIRGTAREIWQESTRLHSVEEAMSRYLTQYSKQIPKGMTVQKTVAWMLQVSRDFCAAEDGALPADLRQVLTAAVREMDEETAWLYLCTYQKMCEMCRSTKLLSYSPEQRTEKLKEDILHVLKHPEERSRAHSIDRLLDSLSSDGLNAYLYTAGNRQLLDALEQRQGAEGCSEVAAELLGEAMERVERYAVYACACYGRVLSGEIPGLNAETVNPGVMTAMLSAGLSKGCILLRLLRGEIDRKTAMELLDRVEKALRYVLAVCIQMSISLAVNGVFFLLITGLELSGAPAAALIALGMLLAVSVLVKTQDEVEGLSVLLTELAKAAIRLPVEGGRRLVSAVGRRKAARTQVHA